MKDKSWTVVTLPDGRRVEYVDAVPVAESADHYEIDGTVLVDGVLLTVRGIIVPKTGAASGTDFLDQLSEEQRERIRTDSDRPWPGPPPNEGETS